MHALLEPLPVKLVPVDDQGRMQDYQMPKRWTLQTAPMKLVLEIKLADFAGQPKTKL